MLQLSNLTSLKQKRKRIGRSGGRGGTSGRGETGQKSRSGANRKIGHTFEGGQMPLSRRIPCRGFTNVHAEKVAIINLRDIESHFENGATVDVAACMEKGLVKNARGSKLKLLAKGALSKSFTINIDAASKSAIIAVENAGGKVLLNKEK
ncbi:50S ribosomal protein L15 [Candidatus Babeliales bacterium]|nr:50S ribosomal protein L15 [Candidatus Babeliales bacterium]